MKFIPSASECPSRKFTSPRLITLISLSRRSSSSLPQLFTSPKWHDERARNSYLCGERSLRVTLSLQVLCEGSMRSGSADPNRRYLAIGKSAGSSCVSNRCACST
jgi:hypothetical protein